MAEERETTVQVLKAFAPLDGMKRENLAALGKLTLWKGAQDIVFELMP